jgi:hypothetical protein
MERIALLDAFPLNETHRQQIFQKNHRICASLVLRSGKIGSPLPILFLNRREAVRQALDPDRQRELLVLHGLFISDRKQILRRYYVWVFQTTILVIYQQKGSASLFVHTLFQHRAKLTRIVGENHSQEIIRIKRLAIRALYALGLDYGLILCTVEPGQCYRIARVIPNPICTHEMKQTWLQIFPRYWKEASQKPVPIEQIRLGADVEFIMKSSRGHLFLASRYFPVRGTVGCDTIWLGQNRQHKPLVEIRPEPSNQPRQLFAAVYQALLKASQKTGHLSARWLAGALPYPGFPLGGHLHFSGIPLHFALLRAFDNYLAFPLIAIEDERGKGRRPHYGFLGDFRRQTHGFEYRTLPSWLVSPLLTKALFCCAQLIAAHYRELSFFPLNESENQQAYIQGNKAIVRPLLPRLWQELRSIHHYALFSDAIDPFYRYLLSGGTWDETSDFRPSWNIPTA